MAEALESTKGYSLSDPEAELTGYEYGVHTNYIVIPHSDSRSRATHHLMLPY
jgi:hypothetical protein